MKLNYIIALTFLFIFTASQANILEEHIYSETDKDGPFESYWKLEASGNDLLRTYQSNRESHTSLFNSKTGTISYKLTNEKQQTSITALRKDNTIVIKGHREGKKFDVTEEIDQLPWCQSLSLALSDFADSQMQNYKFWILRPEKFTSHKMIAEKVGEETILVNNEEVVAQKISVHPCGIGRNFWQGIYWFETNRNLFVKFETKVIIPGLFKRTIELIQ